MKRSPLPLLALVVSLAQLAHADNTAAPPSTPSRGQLLKVQPGQNAAAIAGPWHLYSFRNGDKIEAFYAQAQQDGARLYRMRAGLTERDIEALPTEYVLRRRESKSAKVKSTESFLATPAGEERGRLAYLGTLGTLLTIAKDTSVAAFKGLDRVARDNALLSNPELYGKYRSGEVKDYNVSIFTAEAPGSDRQAQETRQKEQTEAARQRVEKLAKGSLGDPICGSGAYESSCTMIDRESSGKPDDKVLVKADVKTEVKTDAKTEIKADPPKPAVKPDAKTEIKPAVETAIAVKTDGKTDDKRAGPPSPARTLGNLTASVGVAVAEKKPFLKRVGETVKKIGSKLDIFGIVNRQNAIIGKSGCGGPGDLSKSLPNKDQKEKAAALAAAAGEGKKRAAIDAELAKVTAAEEARCKVELARIDPDWGPDKIKEQQDKVRAECDKRLDAAIKPIMARAEKMKVKTKEEQEENLSQRTKAIDENTVKIFGEKVMASANDVLRKEYKRDGSSRRKAIEDATGYKGEFFRPERVDAYFDRTWHPTFNPRPTNPNVAKCLESLGLKAASADAKKLPKYKDPSPDNVDKECGVRAGLIAFMNEYKPKAGGDAATAPADPAPMRKITFDDLKKAKGK